MLRRGRVLALGGGFDSERIADASGLGTWPKRALLFRSAGGFGVRGERIGMSDEIDLFEEGVNSLCQVVRWVRVYFGRQLRGGSLQRSRSRSVLQRAKSAFNFGSAGGSLFRVVVIEVSYYLGWLLSSGAMCCVGV